MHVSQGGVVIIKGRPWNVVAGEQADFNASLYIPIWRQHDEGHAAVGEHEYPALRYPVEGWVS